MDKITEEKEFMDIRINIKRPKKIILFLLSLLILIIIGLTDFFSGYEISFSIFYLLPISFVVYFAEFRYGIIISILSAISWFLADILSGNIYSNVLIPFWNTIMRLGYFLLHSFLLSKIAKLYEKTKSDSLTDQLTGTANTRLFYKMFDNELLKSKRNKKCITIVFFDLDNFKYINDSFGHKVGDIVLKKVAEAVKDSIRETDTFARLGGDEFSIILPELSFMESESIIERTVKNIMKKFLENEWPVTISLGAITYNSITLSIDEMIKQTDELMYNVKKKGKNGIEHIEVA